MKFRWVDLNSIVPGKYLVRYITYLRTYVTMSGTSDDSLPSNYADEMRIASCASCQFVEFGILEKERRTAA